MRALAVAVLFATGCGGTPAPTTDTPGASVAPATPAIAAAPADGDIVERAPCPTAPDAAAFTATADAFLRPEMERAGLTAEMAARPPSTLFTAADHDRLVAAAGDGRCERVLYRVGELKVVGFVVQPPQTAGQRYPVVLWLRGGNRDLGKVGPLGLVQMLDLADQGFVVVATQYRGVDGGDGYDEFGGADTADVHALVPMAAHLPGADVTRVFLLGGSRGAMQGLIAVREGLAVRAAAFRSGMFDLARAIAERPELEHNVYVHIIPGWATARDAAILHRSPIRWVGELRGTPMLLLQARQDWRVSLGSAEEMAATLARAGIAHELVVYEREEHQLAFHRREWIAATVAWFRKHDRP
jgi:dipeptidyl aminopeptidase/acylaminoacyl peptidase